jgi:hypothetical protein
VVAPDPSADSDRRFVQVLCDEEEALGLLAIAAQVYPAIVPAIRAALPSL